MSRTRLGILVASAWLIASPAAAQNTGPAVLAVATETQTPILLDDAPKPETSEVSNNCTYRGGPKSGIWDCR